MPRDYGHRELRLLADARLHREMVARAMNGVCDWEGCGSPATCVFPIRDCTIPGLAYETCDQHAGPFLPRQ